jgi:uncharacterized protein (TIGR02284 family)
VAFTLETGPHATGPRCAPSTIPLILWNIFIARTAREGVPAVAKARSRKIGPILVVFRQSLPTMELKDDLPLLNNLRDLLVDGREGYVKASARMEDARLKGLLFHLSTGRALLLREIDQLRLLADPRAGMRDGGTFKGDLHRTWKEIRDAMSGSANAHVLRECARSEEYLRGRYADLEQGEVHPLTFRLCQRHLREVNANVLQIQELAHKFEKLKRQAVHQDRTFRP